MLENYQKILDLMKASGDALVPKAGKIKDIGQQKQWLTEQDLEIERKITALVQSFAGEHRVYAEEISNDYQAAESVWIIDPLSHTFNYLHGLPHYAVVVSHLYQGEIVFAAVYDPSVQEMFTAQKGEGAKLNDVPVKVRNNNSGTCILYDFYPTCNLYSPEDNIEILSALLSIGRVKNIGSYAVNYAYVACGRAQAVVARNKDTFTEFAGKLLVEEAGGIFSDFDGQDLQVDSRGIIAAADKKMHSRIMELLEDHRAKT